MTGPDTFEFLDGADPEGATPLTPEDAEGLRLSWIATRADLNAAEQQNIAIAARWAFTQRRPVAAVDDLLTIVFSDTLHRRMFGDVWTWAGTHRRRQTNIGVAPHQIITEMHQTFGDVSFWHHNETYSAIEIAVRLHHRLVSIHPYPNGNGRQTRMMADLYLHIAGHQRLTWGSATSAAGSDVRRRYIEAIIAANAHDLAPLLDFATS